MKIELTDDEITMIWAVLGDMVMIQKRELGQDGIEEMIAECGWGDYLDEMEKLSKRFNELVG